MSVCWWQWLEERVTAEYLNCATRKYFEVSATASFNSCYSLLVQSPFPCCYGEFWDDNSISLWSVLMFLAQCPCREVFWVFRTHILPHFVSRIHRAFHYNKSRVLFCVQCCLCLLLLIKLFISSFSLCDLVRGRSGSSGHIPGTWGCKRTQEWRGLLCFIIPNGVLFVYGLRYLLITI